MIPAAGAHGGDGPAIARALGWPVDAVVDLSMSLNPFAPDVEALARERLGSLRRYPDQSAARDLLAAAIGVDRAHVLLTNGGAEAIQLVASAVGGGVVGEPEFSLHPRAADGPRWLSNPNNPTGRLAAADDSAEVWDEAFYPLAAGAWTRGDANAIVVGSLTKVYACPGLRIGYVIAPDVDRLGSGQAEWAVNSLALALVEPLLDRTDLAAWTCAIAARRTELAALLAEHGYGSMPSDAPWLLVDAPGLRDRLALRGVAVRDCASFGLAGRVRIAVPDDRGLERLAEVLPCTTP